MDNRPVEFWTSSHLSATTLLPPGKHRYRLTYDYTTGTKLSAMISLLAIIGTFYPIYQKFFGKQTNIESFYYETSHQTILANWLSQT